MNRNALASIMVLALSGIVAGCNGGDLVGNPGGVFGGGGDGPSAPTVDPTDPHNGGEDTTPPVLNPTTGDQDGDGIPDGTDNIPCRAFYVKVWNQSVSSASANLNADALPAPDRRPWWWIAGRASAALVHHRRAVLMRGAAQKIGRSAFA